MLLLLTRESLSKNTQSDLDKIEYTHNGIWSTVKKENTYII